MLCSQSAADVFPGCICRSLANTALAKPDIGLASIDDKIPQLLAAPVLIHR
jgi:hypothetical protein